MKKLAYIFVLLFAISAVNAQNYNGVEVLGTLESPDPDFLCVAEAGTESGRLFRDGVPSNCPMKACPGDFAVGTQYGWVSYQFRNLLNQDQCITINWNTGTCGVRGHGSVWLGEAYVAPMGAGQRCSDNMFLGDVGGSLTQPFSVEIPAGETFFVLAEETSPGARNCTVGFTIDGEVGCAGDFERLKPLSGGTSVPTMTQWGLFLFGLIVLTLGVVYIYNMSVRTSSVEE